MKKWMKKLVTGALMGSMMMSSCCAQYVPAAAAGSDENAAATVDSRTTKSNLLTRVNNAEVTAQDLGIPGQERYGTSYYAKNIWVSTS